MIDAAARLGAVLGVGHTERYNPAVAAVRPLLDHPRFIEVHRLGTFPDRSLDIDVVFDLMIHDLDVVLSIVPSEVVAVEAVGVAVLTPKPDIANARLKFASGCIANITASRISKDRVRKIRIFQRDAYLSVDYAAQEVERWRLVRETARCRPSTAGSSRWRSEEPLKRELADFVAAVRDKRRARCHRRRRIAGDRAGAENHGRDEMTAEAVPGPQTARDDAGRQPRLSDDYHVSRYQRFHRRSGQDAACSSRMRESRQPRSRNRSRHRSRVQAARRRSRAALRAAHRLRHAGGDKSLWLDRADVPGAGSRARSTASRRKSTR